jgi:hypothetical protein
MNAQWMIIAAAAGLTWYAGHTVVSGAKKVGHAVSKAFKRHAPRPEVKP